MHSMKRSAVVLAAGLSTLAGFVDATGFLHLKGTFVSFMSGNSTQLAVALARLEWRTAGQLAFIVLIFVLGTISGTVVGRSVPPKQHVIVILGFVVLLLALASLSSVFGHPHLVIMFMILAMGVENAVFQRDGEIVVGLTYMTGTLVKVGHKIANALMGDAPWAWIPYLCLWLGLIAGGTLGALSFAAFGLNGLGLAVAWAAGLTLYAWLARVELPE